MMPSKVWTGEYDATGGYLIVKADGEILCYHIYNKNEFENYLLAQPVFCSNFTSLLVSIAFCGIGHGLKLKVRVAFASGQYAYFLIRSTATVHPYGAGYSIDILHKPIRGHFRPKSC